MCRIKDFFLTIMLSVMGLWEHVGKEGNWYDSFKSPKAIWQHMQKSLKLYMHRFGERGRGGLCGETRMDYEALYVA